MQRWRYFFLLAQNFEECEVQKSANCLNLKEIKMSISFAHTAWKISLPPYYNFLATAKFCASWNWLWKYLLLLTLVIKIFSSSFFGNRWKIIFIFYRNRDSWKVFSSLTRWYFFVIFPNSGRQLHLMGKGKTGSSSSLVSSSFAH